jgi:hypothetical protein
MEQHEQQQQQQQQDQAERRQQQQQQQQQQLVLLEVLVAVVWRAVSPAARLLLLCHPHQLHLLAMLVAAAQCGSPAQTRCAPPCTLLAGEAKHLPRHLPRCWTH